MDRRNFLQTLVSTLSTPYFVPVLGSSEVVRPIVPSFAPVLSLSDAFSLYRMAARRNIILRQEPFLHDWEETLHESKNPAYLALQLNSMHAEVVNFRTSEKYYSFWISAQPDSYFQDQTQQKSYEYVLDLLKTSPTENPFLSEARHFMHRYFGSSSQMILDNMKHQVAEVERVDRLVKTIARKLSIDIDVDSVDVMCKKASRYYNRITLDDMSSRHNQLCGPVPSGYGILRYARTSGCETREVWQGETRSQVVAAQLSCGKAICDKLW
jgi:hypothetical protein